MSPSCSDEVAMTSHFHNHSGPPLVCSWLPSVCHPSLFLSVSLLIFFISVANYTTLWKQGQVLEQGINWIKPICAAITESTFGLKKSGHSVSLPRETASPFTNPNQHRSDGVGRQRKVFPQSFLSSTFWQEQARGCYRVKHTTLQCLHDHLHIVACILFCVHTYIYIY